jgi:cytochrome c oxidase subunit 2
MRRAERNAALVLTALALCGCENAPFYTMSRAGAEASVLTTLGWWITGVVTLIALAMGVLIVLGSLRPRGSLDEHLPHDARGGIAWILIGGLATPLAVLGVFFAVTMGTLRALPRAAADPALELKVTAHQWWWKVDYLDSLASNQFSVANEIHVPVGELVQVELESNDVIHSFWVPKLFGKLDAIPGHTNRFVFRADRAGTYWGECAEYCGRAHAHMRFTVIAEPRADFDAWLENQRRPAAPPSEPELITGRDVFEQNACAFCHTVRGTKARGGVAPDLTHFGARVSIGAGRIPNEPPLLQAWITNAKGLKPGARMPALGQELEATELVALTQYLESLR